MSFMTAQPEALAAAAGTLQGIGSTLSAQKAAAEAPQMVKRLQFFIKKQVRTSDLIGKKEQKAVKQGCQVALDILKGLQAVDGEVGN